MKRPPLPEWARDSGLVNRGGMPIVVVDPDAAYPAWLAELGVGAETVDKYWLEVAYQCVKMDVQWACGFHIEIRIRGGEGYKERWALANHPGTKKDIERATQGKEARGHYKRLRGFIPSA